MLFFFTECAFEDWTSCDCEQPSQDREFDPHDPELDDFFSHTVDAELPELESTFRCLCLSDVSDLCEYEKCCQQEEDDQTESHICDLDNDYIESVFDTETKICVKS